MCAENDLVQTCRIGQYAIFLLECINQHYQQNSCQIQALLLELFYHDTPKDEGTSFIVRNINLFTTYSGLILNPFVTRQLIWVQLVGAAASAARPRQCSPQLPPPPALPGVHECVSWPVGRYTPACARSAPGPPGRHPN